MTIALLIVALLVAFLLLGKAADMVVVHIRHIGEHLGIGTVILGLVLGVFTSLPEFALGVNAYANNAHVLSFGNLVGGMAVLLGLVLGVSAMLNRRINTRTQKGHTPFLMAYLFLPILLGIDGQLGIVDAVVLVLFYALLAYSLYIGNRKTFGVHISFRPHRFAGTDFFLVLGGTVFILLLSNGIVRMTLELLSRFNAPEFLVGFFVFALGTNLPEISVAIRSWQRHASELSLSHLFGSAMVNPLLLGIFAFIHPVTLTIGVPYLALAVLLGLLFFAVLVLCRSGNVLTRREGIILVVGYLAVVASQALLY
jgi:cation:H+ antiporter